MRYVGMIGCGATHCKRYITFSLDIPEDETKPNNALRAWLELQGGWKWLVLQPEDSATLCGYFCPSHVEEARVAGL